MIGLNRVIPLFAVALLCLPLRAYAVEDFSSSQLVMEEQTSQEEHSGLFLSPESAGLSEYSTYQDFIEYGEQYMIMDQGPVHQWNTQLLGERDPYWVDDSGPFRSFFDGDDNVYLNEALKVMDVSSHQGYIDWESVSHSEIDAVILRLGYGVGEQDSCFEYNVSECLKYDIPFGVYLFSYAYDADFALNEARWVNAVFDKYGLDKTTPVFYDLERWEWKLNGVPVHTPPQSTIEYKKIVDTFFSETTQGGLQCVSVYSYADYLKTLLNEPSIHEKTSWVATYGPTLEFDIHSNSGIKGWQYTSLGQVAGVSGNVDISAFNLVPQFVKSIGFKDVYMNTPHAGDIEWLASNGISTGFADGGFHPMDKVARCDMAAFLYRLAGSPAYEITDKDITKFNDISYSTPHVKEICWLVNTGITTGFEDGTFRPYASIARCDMAAFLYRFIGSPAYPSNPSNNKVFSDINASTPHAKEVWWLENSDIATGYSDSTYRPFSSVYRQDMAAFLHRTFNYGESLVEDLPEKILIYWQQQGGPDGELGKPLTKVVTNKDASLGVVQFENGFVFTSDVSTSTFPSIFVVDGQIAVEYAKQGGPSGFLGFPVDTLKVGLLELEHGHILYKEGSGAWTVHGGIGAAYFSRYGGASGSLGYPISGEIKCSGGVYQKFEKGRIYWNSKRNLCAKVEEPFLQRYLQDNGSDGLHGFPVGDSYLDAGVLRQDFERGSYWDGQMPERWYRHNVQWAGQPNNYYCGPTSGYMILGNVGAMHSANGTTLSINNVAKYMKTDFYGYTSFADRCFEKGMDSWLGMDIYSTYPTPGYRTTRNAILQSYSAGYPAVLDAQERRGGPHFNGHNNATFSHIMVVDAYNSATDELVLVDPGAKTLWRDAEKSFHYPSLKRFVDNHLSGNVQMKGHHIGVIAPH